LRIELVLFFSYTLRFLTARADTVLPLLIAQEWLHGQNEDENSLMQAVRFRQWRVVRVLVKHVACITKQNSWGFTALSLSLLHSKTLFLFFKKKIDSNPLRFL
jgi:hypothetical protein